MKRIITAAFCGQMASILFVGCSGAASTSDAPSQPGTAPAAATPSMTAGAPVAGAAAAPPASTPAQTTPVTSATSSTSAPAASTPSIPIVTPNETPTSAAPSGTGAGTWCGAKATLDTRCTTCHDGKMTAGAPMSLKTYADLMAPAVSDNTKKVYELVGKRIHDTSRPMPPQVVLTNAELASLDTWIAGGATPGADPTCAASAPTEGGATMATGDGWEWPSHCDATYKILSHGDGSDTTPYVVPAGMEVHPNIAIPSPWNNEQLQAIAYRAINDNPKVLHHWILYGPDGEFVMGWAPGKDHNAPLPSDVGIDLPSGDLVLNMHYNNLGGTKDESDNSGVEICALKKENFRPKTATIYMGFTQVLINIPAHATNYDVTGTCMVNTTEPVTLVSAGPHAHTLARHMKFTVQRASGETIVMHDRAFDFNEQGTFALDQPITLNTGDVVTTTCTYTNDTDNTVTFGENTGNEMCFNFALYYPMNAISCSGGLAIPQF